MSTPEEIRYDAKRDARNMVNVQSYGGGVQSVALAILNATGRVENPAKLAIMADPGMEEHATYAHVPIMHGWLRERGVELVIVQGQRGKGIPLYEYVMERSTVIPVRTETGLGRRQCTQNWKVDAIRSVLKERGIGNVVIQLGISYDEIHRMKDSPRKSITHRFPLVDMRITRADCRQIIRDEGIREPVKSRCQFCPLQRQEAWRVRAASDPDGFEKCAQLEDAVIEREHSKGNAPAYLSSTGRPLRQAFATEQAMFTDTEDDDCGGYCFT